MTKYPVTRVSRELHNFLKTKARVNKRSIRAESELLIKDYVRLKTFEKKYRNKKLLVLK
jgi:hypothetical protein